MGMRKKTSNKHRSSVASYNFRVRNASLLPLQLYVNVNNIHGTTSDAITCQKICETSGKLFP